MRSFLVAATLVLACLCLPGVAARADEGEGEWDDPKPPEKLGMHAAWFRPASAPATAPAPIPASAPASAPAPAPRAVAASAPVAAPGSSFGSDDAPGSADGADRPRGGGGKLDQQAIKEAITPHMGEVRFCFTREQAQNPELSGRVVVRFTIGESGAVSASEVESSSVDSESVERCVAGAVRRWTFPPPKGGSVVVSWPFKVVTMR